MPAYARRELLTAAQRAELLALPTDRLEIGERYSLTPTDFDLINRHRTEGNRLGFAIQLCLLRWLVEIAWGVDQSVSLVRELLGELRRRRILMPSMAELERLVAACRHRVRQRAYEVLTCQLNEAQREALDVTSPVPGPDATDPPGLDPRIGWHANAYSNSQTPRPPP